MEEFFERALLAMGTIDRFERQPFFKLLLSNLSIAARGSYVAAGTEEVECGRELSAFNEILHQVANKMGNDLFGPTIAAHDYDDATWLRSLRDRASYFDVNVEDRLGWAFDQTFARLITGWKDTDSTGGGVD